jgi:sugar phosphate isomerase/epimerase
MSEKAEATMTGIDRRTFVTTVGAAWLSARWASAASVQRVGVQLYTVRDALKANFDDTFAKIAAIGYKEVEFAGYFDRSPQQIREVLAKNGLTAPAAHVDYPSVRDKFPAVLDAATIMGHQYLVNPWIDESLRKQPDIWKQVAETFNKAGELSKKAGIQFAYHNHHFEFAPVDGKTPYDFLLEACDPQLVKMELDLCWITVAGKDPLDYFRRYPGRFPLVHVKGFKGSTPPGPTAPIDKVLPEITDVGSGDAVDWKRIFARSSEAGIKHYFVEHDVPKAPFDSLKASYDFVKQLQF